MDNYPPGMTARDYDYVEGLTNTTILCTHDGEELVRTKKADRYYCEVCNALYDFHCGQLKEIDNGE